MTQMKSIFLQSAEQKMIDQFPEVLHLDATYRVNNRRMPLYVVMVEDDNGKGASVAYALLANERKESIFFFLNTLLKTNPLVKDLATCFIVDKDFTEINVIESLFSKAQVILCRFHVLKTFRLETTKLKITDDERNTIRSILQSLVYSTSGDKYQESLEKLEKIATQGFIQYFTDNWDNCRRMWARYLSSAVKNFSTKTNNRLERHNQEVKKSLNSHVSVAVCLRKLIKCNNQCIARRE
ncbi:uncharacterized protein ZSWIM9-like [Apostichopus japonicus]|uniref:uncharacterized protein ZSWIM9-like n=1 Tax=Stichopus japonicus TaxID=307972 RepID=UPI003AB3AF0D